jgi:hypothetical protein
MTINGEALSQRTVLRYNLGSDCVRILLGDIAEFEVWLPYSHLFLRMADPPICAQSFPPFEKWTPQG